MCVSFAFYAAFKFSSRTAWSNRPRRFKNRERLEIYTILRSDKKFVQLYFGLADICHILLGWIRCDCARLNWQTALANSFASCRTTRLACRAIRFPLKKQGEPIDNQFPWNEQRARYYLISELFITRRPSSTGSSVPFSYFGIDFMVLIARNEYLIIFFHDSSRSRCDACCVYKLNSDFV